MKVDTLKDLEAVIKLCRRQHVEIIKVENIEIVLGKAPVRHRNTTVRQRHISDSITNIDETTPIEPLIIPTDELTDDQKLFGSSDPSVWSDQQ
jgi:hypothetical protein